jgi:gliding motility-associated-like protein
LWSDGSINEDLTGVTSGDYSVTITDSEGCTFTSQLFNIFRQEDLVVDLTTQISAVCETSLVTQQNNISISGGLPPYEINWSAGAVTLGDNTEMIAYENGVYNVIVTDQYGCEVDTEIIVDFDELSITGASFDYLSTGNLDCGLSIFNEIEFTNTSDGDVLGVTWDFGDGSALVSGEIVTHQYITAGEFEVTVTAQYNYGCVEVYTEEIEVSDGYDIMLPTAFSPNNDGINDTIRPVYNCVNDINMSVYDTFGSLLYYENNIELQGWNGFLDGKKAENGNYLIVVNGTTIFGEEINLNGVFVLLR